MRVLTVNIRARNGLYSTRERLLRQSVGVLAPDLHALQEVDAGPGNSNQAEELFSSLGYSVDYERRDGDNRADPGIAGRPRAERRGHRWREGLKAWTAAAAALWPGGDQR